MELTSFTSSLFRPNDEQLSPRAKTQVQLHRLLSLLGALLVPLFDVLYAFSDPGAIDPTWARLGIAGLFTSLLAASYASRRVRRHYVEGMRGILYLLMGWFALVTVLNRFAGDYAVGLLLVYAVLTVIVGVGTWTIGPVLRFAGFGLLLTAGGVAVGPPPRISPLILLGSMATVVLVGSIAIEAHLSAQRKLRDRDARLRGLANSLPGVVFQFYVRPDGTYGHHFVSEYAEEGLGLSTGAEDFYEQFVEGIPPSHREAFVESLDEAVEADAPWRFEMPFEKPSGERIWLLGTSTPERREGTLVFNGVMLDITDWKEAERALREERDRFATLFESLPTPVVRCTAEEEGFFITAANEAFERVFGVDASAVEGKDIDQLLVPEDRREEAVEIAWRALEEGTQQVEARRKAADGLRDFQLQVAGRKREESPSEVYVIYTDITEQKQREQALQDRQKKIESLYGAANLTLTANSPEAVAARTTGVLQDVFDYPLGIAGLRDGRNFVPKGTASDEDYSLVSSGAASIEVGDVVDHVCRSGETAVVEGVQALDDDLNSIAAVPIGTHGAIVVGQAEKGTFNPFDLRLIEILGAHTTGVLDRLDRERKLEEAKAEAEEAARLKTAMLANMSHEIRTPLIPIIRFSEELKENLEGTLATFAEKVHNSSERLMKTLDSVLSLSQPEAGTYDLEREQICLEGVAEEAAELLRPRAEEKSVAIETNVPDDPVEGSWNEGAVHHIAGNLIETAIKFTPEGGDVEVRVRKEEKEGVFEVKDSGIGIGEESLSRGFEAFEQGSESLDRNYEGSRLGLPIAETLIEALGGTVKVETEKGAGSRLTVRLPTEKSGEPT